MTTWTNINAMSPEQRLFAKGLCMMLLDAIDGPMPINQDLEDRPKNDIEGEYHARKEALFKVWTCDEDFRLLCYCAGLVPEAVSEAFRAERIQRDDVMSVFKAIKPD